MPPSSTPGPQVTAEVPTVALAPEIDDHAPAAAFADFTLPRATGPPFESLPLTYPLRP